MAPEYLSITERWIRCKVHLQHNCLADVRSLCLPGTYEGKIHHLGNSLKNFVRLKILDLSHNALVSVEGIQHLKMLEVLNLYYNRIPSLKDILVLCKLKALRELDLRLNPVVRNNPDYRLYLVYALPNLRKLDDCSVRDSERKASILHFPTDVMFDELQMTAFPLGESERSIQPRTASVNRLIKKRCFLDENDEAVLDLVTKSNLELTLKSSTNKQPKCQLFDLLEENGNFREGNCEDSSDRFLHSKRDPTKYILRHSPEIKNQHQHQSCLQPVAMDFGERGRVLKADSGSRLIFVDPVRASLQHDPKLFETQPRIAAQGNFTAKPEDPPAPSVATASPVKNRPSGSTTSGSQLSECPKPASRSPKYTARTLDPEAKSTNQESFIFNSSYGKPLALLLALVDKHWSGVNSLRNNQKFLVQAVQILSKMEQDFLGPEEVVKSLKADIETLNTQRQSEVEKHHSEVLYFKRQLEEAQSSIEDLNQQLHHTLEDNLSLQKQLIKLERRLLRSRMDSVSAPIEAWSTGESVKGEVEALKERLQQAERVQGLADMLKESHRSLVRNNESLLAELEQTRAQHREDLEQLNQRFRELRTVSSVPEMRKMTT